MVQCIAACTGRMQKLSPARELSGCLRTTISRAQRMNFGAIWSRDIMSLRSMPLLVEVVPSAFLGSVIGVDR
jgi:hypothetical protein